MFFKRQLPVYIMVSVGLLTLLGHFIKGGSIENFIQKDSLSWFNIIASFSILLGAFNLLKIHSQKFFKKQEDWQYSLIALIGFAIMIIGGFFFKGANYLSIDIDNKNFEKLAFKENANLYVLNNQLTFEIEEYFQNTLISVCNDSNDNKIPYSNSLSCYENGGSWETKSIDPSEFNRIIYDKDNKVIDDAVSSEVAWMVYDYLEKVFRNKR